MGQTETSTVNPTGRDRVRARYRLRMHCNSPFNIHNDYMDYRILVTRSGAVGVS